MRLPFLSSKANHDNGRAEGLVEKSRRKTAADEDEADEAPRWRKTATGKKAIAKAERKQAKKKAAWEREQERRRLHALARWESALRSEPQAGQSAAEEEGAVVVVPGAAAGVLSANGRLENSRRSRARRSRRYLDADHLDEVSSDTDTDDESDQSDVSAGNRHTLGDGGNLPAGPVFQLGSSAAAQLHQVAAMRELPMLERCATRQAPSSFFVDMLLLGDSSSAAAPRTERRGRPAKPTAGEKKKKKEEEDGEEEVTSRHRRVADKKRATMSCPTGRTPPSPRMY